MQTRIMSAIENALNGGIMSGATDRVKCANDFLMHAHRFLQSEMFDFVMSYIKLNAKHYRENPSRWFDGRNEHVGRICSEICDLAGSMEISCYDQERLDKAFPYAEAEDTRIDEDMESLWRRETTVA